MLAKQLIHNQVKTIATDWYAQDKETKRAASKAFVHYCLRELLELSDEESEDCVVDGAGDFNIDAIWFDEPESDEFEITLIQAKYSADLDKEQGIAEKDIVKMLTTLRHLFYGWEKFDIKHDLKSKLAEINAYIQEGVQPVVTVYWCNNGQKWSADAQAHIDSFLAESPANRQVFTFHYLNHENLFALSQRTRPVECRLSFRGKFIDQEINFKRALIGTVPITDIAEIMDKYSPSILRLNVREFLGFKKSVNDSIRETLQDDDKRKNFYFLNNGITIICKDVGYAPGGSDATTIKLSDAHIINGGQTSRVIQEVLSDNRNDSSDFSSACVLTRIYKVGNVAEDDGLVSDITLATNSQTAISLRDLHANDPVQIRLEAALSEHGITYIRKRHQKKVRKGDVRPETLAAVVLAAVLHKPHEAKYRKAAHFSRLYSRIFDDKKLLAADLACYLTLFRLLENARKRPGKGFLENYPFVPFASYHLLMILACMGIDETSFAQNYPVACEKLAQQLAHVCSSTPDTLETITQLKRESFSRQLIECARATS